MADILRLKKSNCKNCYKCIRHCPVKSIRFSGNQAHIVGNECILCGQCFVGCPQNAKEIKNDTEKVKVMIESGVPVIASVAPSFIANYEGVGIEQLRKALLALGFSGAEETAVGATIVKKEYERILREEKPDVIITSCCHSVNLLIQKHYPAALPYLAKVVSPMQAHCMDIKARMPEAKTVFIGPCVAKKDEAEYYAGTVDAVLTYEELDEWLTAASITLEEGVDNTSDSRARIFPTAGGVIKSMTEQSPDYKYISVDGVDNCITAIADIIEGKIHNCFVEMNACTGSCVGGPVMEKYHRSPVRGNMTVSDYAGVDDFDHTPYAGGDLRKNIEYIPHKLPMPTEAELLDILRRMGKTKPEDELDCGSCGYESCRKKAVAIFQGKADVSMCLPYLKDKAESFSDTIVKNTPNGIIVLNENLEVQQINRSACKMLNLRSAADVMGEQVIRILDPQVFLEVQRTGRAIRDKRVYLAEYDKYVEQSVLADRDYHALICLMRDVTDEETERRKKENISSQTVEIADKVVEKQMRIVQEIASLLGETAAETKIALTKLKESIKDE